jgi:hypothetical protein
MIENFQVVDTIERANDAQPFCPCGSHTTPVWRDGTVWLECATLSEPRRGRVQRVLAAVMAPAHVRDRIVDVPPLAVELDLVA